MSIITLLIVIVTIAIIGYFVITIYQHDNTTFYKLTGYSYFDLWTNKKVSAAHKLVGALDHVQGAHKILVNVQVSLNDELHTIDGVFLHESGIYVINIKEMTGWINGREQDIQWVQLLHKGKQRAFENPIHETKRLSYALQDYLPEINEALFESLVVFTNDCSFQQVELQSDDVDVIKTPDLKQWAKSLDGKRLTETEIQTIFSALEGIMEVKKVSSKIKTTVA